MYSYIPRQLENDILQSLRYNPVTAVIGPRQCGKSTLVKKIITNLDYTVYLDLERPSDLQKLEDPEWYLESHRKRLVCLDEIQRKPDLFPVLRSLIDEDRRPGMYLILGSASRDMLQQSSETLAGRVAYKKLTPFLWQEVIDQISIEAYLSRGGFPPSTLAANDTVSFEWRTDFISTFLERDLLQFAGFTPKTMRRLWQMLAHSNGQPINYSKIGESLGVSHTTIRNYTDLLEGTFMVKQLPPFRSNIKKRLVKSPKVYITDTGLTAALLQLKNFDQIAGHPVFGSLWETIVMINLTEQFPELTAGFYRTSHGNEIDLILSNDSKVVAIECKATLSPSLTKGNYSVIEDIKPDHVFVAAPVESGYPMKKNIDVVSLFELIEQVDQVFGR